MQESNEFSPYKLLLKHFKFSEYPFPSVLFLEISLENPAKTLTTTQFSATNPPETLEFSLISPQNAAVSLKGRLETGESFEIGQAELHFPEDCAEFPLQIRNRDVKTPVLSISCVFVKETRANSLKNAESSANPEKVKKKVTALDILAKIKADVESERRESASFPKEIAENRENYQINVISPQEKRAKLQELQEKLHENKRNHQELREEFADYEHKYREKLKETRENADFLENVAANLDKIHGNSEEIDAELRSNSFSVAQPRDFIEKFAEKYGKLEEIPDNSSKSLEKNGDSQEKPLKFPENSSKPVQFTVDFPCKPEENATISPKTYHKTPQILENLQSFRPISQKIPAKFENSSDFRDNPAFSLLKADFEEQLSAKLSELKDIRLENSRLVRKLALFEEEKKALWLQLKELQDENDALLKMNYELTKEKTVLLTKLEDFKAFSPENANFAKNSPLSTVFSSNAAWNSTISANNEEITAKLCEIFEISRDKPEELLEKAAKLAKKQAKSQDFAEKLANSWIWRDKSLEEKVEKLEQIFTFFEIRVEDDFLDSFHELYKDFFQMSQFLREAKDALNFDNEVRDDAVFHEILSVLREKSVNYY